MFISSKLSSWLTYNYSQYSCDFFFFCSSVISVVIITPLSFLMLFTWIRNLFSCYYFIKFIFIFYVLFGLFYYFIFQITYSSLSLSLQLIPSSIFCDLSIELFIFDWVFFIFSSSLLKCSIMVMKSLRHVRLFVTPWTVAHQAPPSMEFSRQEYWSGLPFPSPGDLPNPGIEPRSPTLQADALPSEPWGS